MASADEFAKPGTRHNLPYLEIDALLTGRGYVSSEVSTAIQVLQARAPGARPLTRHFAEVLLNLSNTSHVAILTGFVVPAVLPQGENDGPLGSVVLARALVGAGLHPILFADPPLLETTRWLVAEMRADVPVHCLTALLQGRFVKHLGAVIAVEKPGRSAHGVMHTFDGHAIVGGSLSVDAAFERWGNQAVPTLSIGDRGNEVGFGALCEAVLEAFPSAATCRCGCDAGIVSTTSADLVLPAAVSNWGAYGVAAALALLQGDPDLAHCPADEARLLHVAAVRGCADGVVRRCGFGVDGLSGSTSVQLVSELHDMVRRALGETHG